ncbi:wax ester/triacylglycerol synthase family O-acyltransferase [Nocardia sp. CDC159]|uniref:Diacylglycerol O-acyltransferase n=1 Tax=Nocardia pulmonis TaxID=2951408 RepID=A0A9X2E1C6_9NOCA|nr:MULTISPECIES: wax ester/triacylglycerol synthase family O-acyltransferase [Nocardia]MCM6772407.1 wax ester/triacylglycerol synthase family O-acyltransferase [Nocardia pulmonis]MCM6784935.1 wax ester/triacylglycerol synthase family O-acyltransferase [Nocardia sp. CDC159]
MTELRPLDTGFIELEDSDRHISLGIGAVAIIAGAPPSREEFRAGVAVGLDRNPRLRQRVRRAPLDVKAPTWQDDPNFDLAHHIRWTALPGPGDERSLRELVANELVERLDRDHPLWECVVVDHLAGDRWAVLVKAHHSMVDGISGITLFESFCDRATGEGNAQRAEKRGPSTVFETVTRALRLPVTAARLAVSMLRTLPPVLYAAAGPATGSSFNGPIGRQRRYAIARASLPEIREIGRAFGVTVNDVAVAAVASAYREVLLGRGEQLTPGKVRVLVPVSVRAEDAKYVPDNRVSAMVPTLPVEVANPVERLKAVHGQISAHRSRGEAEAQRSLLSLAGLLPFPMVAWTFRLASHYPQHAISALATNVPGPRHRLTMHGREVLEILPCIPIAMRLRTTIAILGYADRLAFGITADYDSTPDIDALAAGIKAGVGELLSRARERGSG